MPLKKSVRSKTTAGAKKAQHSNKIASAIGTIGASAMVMALLCVLAAGMLTSAHDTSDATGLTATDAASDAAAPAKKVTAMRGPSASVPATTPTTGATGADAPDADSATSPAKKSSPVTIVGCLARDNNAFRLKDTTGDDAPKARSWKSGFLKKGSTSLDLAETGSSVKLRDHVGKRVSVTGTLVDRQMLVRSVRRVAPSCN